MNNFPIQDQEKFLETLVPQTHYHFINGRGFLESEISLNGVIRTRPVNFSPLEEAGPEQQHVLINWQVTPEQAFPQRLQGRGLYRNDTDLNGYQFSVYWSRSGDISDIAYDAGPAAPPVPM